MSALTRVVPSLTAPFGHAIKQFQSTLTAPITQLLTPTNFVQTSIRTVIRCHFPRPSERKRVLRHGWKKRMSTPEGRRILMNRILKGRHVYSH